MSISNWLESPEQFRKLLSALVSDKWEQLRDSLSMDDPVLRQFALTQWAQRRLPDEPDGLTVAALLIAYHFRCLLVDSLRTHNLTGNGLQDELNVTLLMPLYIWPAYRIWVLQEFPAKARLNQSQAIPWILNRPLRLRTFKELDIPEPNEKFLAYIEVKQNTTNLSRWVKAGLESHHFVMHPVTKNEPPFPITTNTDAHQEFDEKPAEILDSSRFAYDAGISQLANLPEPDLARDTGKPNYKYPDSPIYRPYLQWEYAYGTFIELQHSGDKHPSLCQVARKIIDQRVSSASLDLHQQAQAFELLTELPEWIDLEKTLDACISLKSIEARWGQFHKSDVSPLIKVMLETNLLQINGLDGGVRFPQPLIHDYLLSMAQVKRLRSTNPIPPRGIALTNWLHWMVCHWLDRGDRDRAGTTLWNAVGTLPGFKSGVWRQIGLILADLPEEVMREPRIWLLVSLVREAAEYNLHLHYYLQGWLAENMSSPMDASVSIDIQQSEFARILKDYGESLRRYHSIVSHDATCILEIALGYDPSCRSDHWIRKHALSALMTLNPEKEVEIRLLPFVYQPKRLCEVILDFASKEYDWELKLAACESLVSWGVKESKAILAESKITKLPNEYYHRSVILRNALEGRPGYANWV